MKLVPMTIIAGAALVALSTTAHADTTVTADCVGFTITSTGYPDGSTGLYSWGDGPPATLTLNGTTYRDWPLDLDGVLQYTVMPVPGDGNVIGGQVTCLSTLTPEPEPEIVDIGSAAPIVVATAEPPVPTFWAAVELAPPW